MMYILYHYRMFGLFQTVFYFSYMALGSMALGVLCGKTIIIAHVNLLWLHVCVFTCNMKS